MTTLDPAIFKKYDIRGQVGAQINAVTATRVAHAFGTHIQRHSGTGSNTVYVGHDNRPSSRPLAIAFCQGLVASGCEVITLGQVPTPLLYFAVARDENAFGAMITASHLSSRSNGFKFCHGRAPLYGETITQLRDIALEGTFASGKGSERTHAGIVDEYMAYVQAQITLARPGLRVVVDSLNGAASEVAPQLLRALSAEVIPLHCDPAQPYPFKKPDPSVASNLVPLQAQVLESRAVLGVAYDGDADRLGVVDDQGRYVSADLVLALLARDVLQAQPGGKVVFDILCTQAVEQEIRANGGVPIFWKSGHAFIKDKLLEEQAVLAGESSGHIFFADRYFGYDDGIYASCRLLELLARSDQPLSALLATLPPAIISPEERPACPENLKFQLVSEVEQTFREAGYPLITVDGVRITFPEGWGLVRASNTEAVLSLRFEAATETALRAYHEITWDKLIQVGAQHGVAFTPHPW